MGNTSTYTDEVAGMICEEIATTSKSLRTICKELKVPIRTVMDWLSQNETFSQQYARAKEEQADLLAEEIIEIADDTSNDTFVDEFGKERCNSEWINRSRLRVDARKWVAAKLKPKKYGDKLDVDHTSGGEKIMPTIVLNPDSHLQHHYGFKPETDDSLPTTHTG